MIFGLIAVTVLIATLLPMQAGINAELTRTLKHPLMGAFISFAIGSITLAIAMFFEKSPIGDLKRLLQIPPQLYIGGAMGALFVGCSIFMIPRLGATTMMACFVTGQLLSSIVIDHNGWFNLPVYAITPQRIVGVALLFAGVFLVVKKSA